MAAWICPCCCSQRRMLRPSLPFQQGDWKRYARPDIAQRYFFFFFEGGAVVGGLVLWRSRSLVSGTLCWLIKLFLHLFVALFFIFYFFCAKKGELKPPLPHSAHPAPLRRPTRRKLSVTSLKRESKEEAPANEETLFRKNCFSEWFLFSRVQATFLRKHYASSANFSSFACCKKRFVKQRVYPGAS